MAEKVPAGGDDPAAWEAVSYEAWRQSCPCALGNFDALMAPAGAAASESSSSSGQGGKGKKKKVCVFLDYDGTLSPIVNDPDKAVMSEAMRAAVSRVSACFPTSIISGRSLEKVKGFVQLDNLFYAGSHGLDIESAKPRRQRPAPDVAAQAEASTSGSGGVAPYQAAAEHIEVVRGVREVLVERTKGIAGVTVEDNKFCCSVHFRNMVNADAGREGDASGVGAGAGVAALEAIVREVVAASDGKVQMKQGRKVFEVRPQVTWNKGHAVSYLMNGFRVGPREAFALYLGDDKTDEDAFAKLAEQGSGVGVLVSTVVKRSTRARFSLRDPADVLRFLQHLAAWGEDPRNEARWSPVD